MDATLKLPLVYRRTASEIINLRIMVDAGARNEDPDDYGTAHFLEHMFFKGTQRRSYKEVNALTSKLGDANAYTSHQQTVYHLTCLADDFETALALLAEMVFEPAFPEDELKREIGVVLEELQMYEDNPHGYFATELAHNLFGATGHPIIGTRESVQAMSVDRLHAFRKRWYGGNRMAVGVFGNIDQERVRSAIDSTLPATEYAMVGAPHESLNMEDFHFHHASKQAMVELVYPGVGTKEEYRLGHLPDVVANPIGGGVHSLLFDRIREELGLCYHVSAAHFCYRDLGTFVTYCALDEANIPRVVDEMKSILAQVCERGVGDELLATAKKNWLFSKGRQLESSSGTGRAADSVFAVGHGIIGCLLDFDDYRQKVMAITNADVIEFARRTFGPGITPKLVTMTPENNRRPERPLTVLCRESESLPNIDAEPHLTEPRE